MAEVWFYHLETSTVEQVLPELLEKAAGRGWRAYVHCTDAGRRHRLDEHLWAYRADSFIGHGDEAADFPEDQPVLLGASGQPRNDAQMFVSVSPADIPQGDFDRTLILFEESDPEHLAWARAQWKRLKGDTISLSYWRQDVDGRWQKKN